MHGNISGFFANNIDSFKHCGGGGCGIIVDSSKLMRLVFLLEISGI